MTLHADKATTYVRVELYLERNFPPWKIAADHPLSLACIGALETAGVPVKIGAEFGEAIGPLSRHAHEQSGR